MIDLRSDTLTKPTPEMLDAMMSAEVGDDVFGEDPTVNQLEEKIAAKFEKEAALFCASATMSNQIALRVNTSPQDEVICDKDAHIYRYEGGGMMTNSHVSVRLLDGDKGRINASQIQENINPDDIHFPRTRLVSIENTMNKGGGCCYDFQEVQKIREVCLSNKLQTHLDGARIFNALVAKGESALDWGSLFDTISVCFSKGLGAPVGSALLGSKETIENARRVRKIFGGGWRQAGYLAAACSYALDNHIDRLTEDHIKASEIGKCLAGRPFIKEVIPIETNIIIAECEGIEAEKLVQIFRDQGIRCFTFSTTQIRLVTHLDISIDQMNDTVAIIKSMNI